MVRFLSAFAVSLFLFLFPSGFILMFVHSFPTFVLS